MSKALLFSLSLIFFISGTYFYIQQNSENKILFSENEANFSNKNKQPMLAEISGIEIFYEDFILDFKNNNVVIDLKFLVKGFSLSFNGYSKFNSNFINKNDKFYLSDLKYDSFELVNKNENTDFSDVFINKYRNIIENKIKEDLNNTLEINSIYELNSKKEIFVMNFDTVEDNLIIKTKEINKYYNIFAIISFILSGFFFIAIPFLKAKKV